MTTSLVAVDLDGRPGRCGTRRRGDTLPTPYMARWHNGCVRILVVEDEASLREGIVDLLAGDGHDVVAVGDGIAAVEAGLRDGFAVVVLDLMLPRLDGMEVCRRLRAARPGTPILMLTARGSEDDKVRGLMEGADDYVTKPFSARELLARVRALGRRAPAGGSLDQVEIDGAVIDLARMIVMRGGAHVALTPREVGIVRWLHRHRDRVVSRAELLEQVFGQRGDLQTRAVDMAIAVLRKKLEADPARPTVIISVKGAGYAWRLAR
jgi:DNA-binding response OmpR family regulator